MNLIICYNSFDRRGVGPNPYHSYQFTIRSNIVSFSNLDITAGMQFRFHIPLTTVGQTTRSMDSRLEEIATFAQTRIKADMIQNEVIQLCLEIDAEFGGPNKNWFIPKGKTICRRVATDSSCVISIYANMQSR